MLLGNSGYVDCCQVIVGMLLGNSGYVVRQQFLHSQLSRTCSQQQFCAPLGFHNKLIRRWYNWQFYCVVFPAIHSFPSAVLMLMIIYNRCAEVTCYISQKNLAMYVGVATLFCAVLITECHDSHKRCHSSLNSVIYNLNYFSFEYTLLQSFSQFLLLCFFYLQPMFYI